MGGTYRRSRTRKVVSQDQPAVPFAGVLKLKCRCCTICIGPGFICDEVYYDPQRMLYLCYRCADRVPEGPGYLLIGRAELAATPGGRPLLNLLQERVRQLASALQCPSEERAWEVAR
jgi:hypothetical protein